MSISVMLTLTDVYWKIDSEAPLTEMFDRCAGDTCHAIFKKVCEKRKLLKKNVRYLVNLYETL